MAVLKLDPTKAPDFSSSSQILARAGLSLDRAFDSAQDLLGSYQEGAQEKVDNAIFAETAGMNREQLQAFFDNNGLKGRQLSQKGRERLGGQAKATADTNRVRGLNESTIAQTLRLNAVRGEEAARESFSVDARDFDIGGAGIAVDARREQLALGNVLPGTSGANILNAAVDSQGAPVSRAPAHLIGKESGGNFGATNEAVGGGGIKGHDGRVQAGAQRITDAKRAGILPENMTREEFRNSEPLQIAFENWHFGDIDKNIEKNGYSQYIGTKINGVTVTHAGMVDVQHLGGATGLKKFLESGGKYNKADENGTTLTDYLQMGGRAAVAERVGPTGASDPIAIAAEASVTPGASLTPAQDLNRERQASNPFQTQAQALAREADAVAGRQEGQNIIDANAAKVRAQGNAEAALAAIDSAEITTVAGVTKSMRADLPEGTLPQHALETMELAISYSEKFDASLNPNVPLPDGVTEAMAAEMFIQDNALAAFPQTFTDDLSKKLKPDPLNIMIAQLELESDPQNPTRASGWWIFSEDGKDKNILDTMITDTAEKGKVTREVAAAALIKFFRRDPYGPNTANARFRPEDAVDWLLENMDEDSMRIFQGKKLSIVAKKDRFAKDAKDLNTLMVRREKQLTNGTDTRPIDVKIERLTNSLLRGHTSDQSSLAKEAYKSPDRSGSVDALNRIPPGKTRDAIAKTLAGWVRADPKLSANEKRLLLAEING